MAVLSAQGPSQPSSHALPYRIGVDVGGTNTDAVIIDTSIQHDRARSVLASHKASTTSPNVADGIETAVKAVLEQSNVDCTRIASLAIGTTHFINAIVEQDESLLSRVAVMRLSKSFTREIPPFSDFPPALRALMQGYCTQVDGGLQIDGSPEAPIDEKQVIAESEKIRQHGMEAVVVSGVFSPLDQHLHQEQTVRDIIQREIPNISVVCSSEISNIGFLERENAAILNASILRFARQTIREFRTAMRRLGLRCRLYLTQNDGTLIDARSAAHLPIRTLSSGATNSMRGAAYLCGLYPDGGTDGPTTIVCDVGGTTSDFGVLLPSGYPRRALADTSISGVKVNFDMPQVDSIGIGGGSIVRQANGKVTIGRDSVGCDIRSRALVFGGETTTATDIAVAIGNQGRIGDASLVKHIGGGLTSAAMAVIKQDWERVCDVMKTSPEPLPLILVGGGSIISPPELDGISEIIRPAHHTVANAIGAAIARVSAKVDIVQSISDKTVAQAMEHVVQLARERVVAAGARAETVVITAQESLPLQYIDNQVRTLAMAVGDFEPLQIQDEDGDDLDDNMNDGANGVMSKAVKKATVTSEPASPTVSVESYRPTIEIEQATGRKVWVVSPTDLEWMADGCYVLGCGGGGSPYPEMLKLQQHIAEGHKLRIMDVDDLDEDAKIYCK